MTTSFGNSGESHIANSEDVVLREAKDKPRASREREESGKQESDIDTDVMGIVIFMND